MRPPDCGSVTLEAVSLHSTGGVRSHLLRLAVVALLLCLLPMTQVERASACVFTVPTPEEAYLASDMVFVGRVVQMRQGPGGYWAEFEVLEVWKGRPFETVWVNERCGLSFDESNVYLVYAHDGPRRDGGNLRSGGPSGTQLLKSGTENYGEPDLELLGESQPPEPGTAGPEPAWGDTAEHSAFPGWAIGLVAAAAIALAGVGLIAVRRRRLRSNPT